MNEPNQPLRDYRGMQRLLEERQADWPADLVLSASRAHSAFYIIAHNPPNVIEAMKNFKSDNPDKIPADYVTTWETLMADIADFPKRYAEWVASKHR
jgi:hypothetical protein